MFDFLYYVGCFEWGLQTFIYFYGTYRLLFNPTIKSSTAKQLYIYPRTDKRISPLAYLPPHVQYKVFTYLSRKDLDNCKQILPYWEWIINFGDGTLRKYSRKERKEIRKWKILANIFFASRICGDLTVFLFLLVAFHLPFILNYIYYTIISLWVLEYISVSIVTNELLDGNGGMIQKYIFALIDKENYEELSFGYLFYWFNSTVSIIVNFTVILYAINYVPTIILLSIYSGLLIASFVLSSREIQPCLCMAESCPNIFPHILTTVHLMVLLVSLFTKICYLFIYYLVPSIYYVLIYLSN
uniref:Uncharacterized protein n=1 Tax=Meloidogyne enterolobii TaxID=390850 RepID=A0A6V7Y9H4_MELEN|nr:unnamed protein product [Meloidogyne enterolobii]CAD2204910.1 unnamed protein product [Meloidogyne enterolobii]CAD2208181.1 unnamed protein product [Meloidogyne enterolobii]